MPTTDSPASNTLSQAQRWIYMLGLIVAAEAVFALPFHLARYFRPTLMEAFNISATELGAAQGMYGIFAMLSYFPGGPLADRFSARKLMAMSLWSTAAGGLYMATFPGYAGAVLIWAFFGVTTILLFWAALIKATRDWGGSHTQGRAYGLLDGGRGLVAALLASVGVLIFAVAFPDGYDAASGPERAAALRSVIYGYVGFTALTGVFIWFALPEQPHSLISGSQQSWTGVARNLKMVMAIPAVWLQALIVICAYVGFKGVENYSLFAVEVYGIDEVRAAEIIALSAWMRPIAALGAGLLADRFDPGRMLLLSFVMLLLCYMAFAFTTPGAVEVLIANVLLSCIAIFALRGLYFAVFEQARVPLAVTGSAVGLVSMIGYTPDIFVTFVAGLLIDTYPGGPGHQYFFFFLMAFTAVGAAASMAFLRLTRQPLANAPA